ncbi:hypothetical protein NVS55_37710 [Myxococcus stipitatus]|uniref:hypothetical protein n=1 Tax=Myxococcus stipitatus TaxID=83455 RepID=UPI0031450EB8
MKPTFRKSLWLFGIAFVPVSAMAAGLLYVSKLKQETPADPTGPLQEGLAKAGDVRQVSEHGYEVTVATSLTEQLSQQHESPATQARIVPAFKEGKATGFKLFAIRPGSIYARLGFENGDIIQRVNGHSLDTPQKAMTAYTELQDVRRVEVDLLRDDVVLHKVYDLK